MRTEIAPRAKKKSRLDRIAHYNMHMVLKIKEEDRVSYVYEARKAYRKCRNKKAKKEFLDRFVEESGYNRKQAIRLLQKRQNKKETLRRGAPSKLSDDDIRLIRIIWKYTNYVNAEYLHANLRRWLTDYSLRLETPLSEKQIERICSVSYKTIERALKRWRAKLGNNNNWMKETAIREGISLVERIRHVEEPGYICMDTVAHCGRSTAGSFVWTLTWTDIYTGFTINRAVWNKGFEGMKDAFEYCLSHTPFPIKSINVDNGSEFLNCHAIRYWKSKEGIKLTHSRPSMKNDNAHAEQKNRTHVRELFARYRFDEEIYVDEMNKIYEQTYKFRNFILPCKVLKTRILNHNSNRYRRVYDKACTPVERIINYPGTSKEVVEELQRKHTTLNYFDESLKLQSMLNDFFAKVAVNHSDELLY